MASRTKDLKTEKCATGEEKYLNDIFQMMKNNTAPKAIICINAEPIIATGAIMSDIPMVDSPSETKDLTNGTLVEVDGDNGTITIL